MEKTNYSKITVLNESRVELHDKLNLTGAEISVNMLPAKASVPFIHSHKHNEEIYIILEGEGTIKIDDESIVINKNDVIRVAPSAKRQLFASENSGLKYICIQVKENSLDGFTQTDAVIC